MTEDPRSVEADGTLAPTVAGEKFERLVVPEIPVLYRVARSMTRSVHDAEDLVQATLVRAFEAIDRLDEDRNPRPWLVTILRNLQRSRWRRRSPLLLKEPDLVFDNVADLSGDGPEAALDAQHSGPAMQALATLPLRLRAVVELVDLAGLRYQEAADVLGVPVGTVTSRVHRARDRMRRQLR
jgi:RNA polymerase sigma-70 factor (ECF subfamily)